MARVLELQIHELQIIAGNCCYSASTKLVYNHVVFLFNSSPGYSRKHRLQTMGKTHYQREILIDLVEWFCCYIWGVENYMLWNRSYFYFVLAHVLPFIDRCMHKFKQPFRKIKKRRNVYLRSGINAGSDTYDIYWSSIWLDQLFILKADITSQVKSEIQLISCDICS